MTCQGASMPDADESHQRATLAGLDSQSPALHLVIPHKLIGYIAAKEKHQTLGSGTKSGPKGSLMLVRVDSTLQTPRNSSGKYRSAGPPPIFSQARSNAGGSLLAYGNAKGFGMQPLNSSRPPACSGHCL